MKPLAMNQRMLALLCVLPIDEAATIKEKLACFLFSSVAIFTIYTSLTSSAVFFVKFVSIDLEESLYSLFQVASIFATANAIGIAALMRHRIPPMFANLTKIYDERKFNA